MTTPVAGSGPEPDGRLAPMRWWHIPAVAALEETLFPEDSPWTEQMFWSELAAGHYYRVAVDEGGVILGYAGLARGIDEAEVQTIGVDLAHQGRGIGRSLLRDLLAAAGERAVHLEVRTDNAGARGLYESEGFALVGVRRRYYQPSGADAYTMTRPRPRRRF